MSFYQTNFSLVQHHKYSLSDIMNMIPWERDVYKRQALFDEGLMTFYQTNFSLVQHHKYSLTDIMNMIPWEREVYVNLLVQHLQKERDRIEEERRKRR